MAENTRLRARRAGAIFKFNANSQCGVGRVEGTSEGLELCSSRCLVPSKDVKSFTNTRPLLGKSGILEV